MKFFSSNYSNNKWITNSSANLIGGLASAGMSILLPAMMAKYLSTEAFSVWALAFQVITYVNLLGLGLQNATARAIAYSTESDRPKVTKAAISLAKNASIFALIILIGLTSIYPMLFPQVNPGLIYEFRIVIFMFGLASISQIVAQVDFGVFQGLHKNIIFISPQMAVRFLTLFLVWLGIKTEQSMGMIALLMAFSMALIWPLMRIAFFKFVPWSQEIKKVTLNKVFKYDLLKYCGTLSVWSISTLLINSMGLLIVGRFDLKMAGAYSIAMTAALVVLGFLGSSLSPLMTITAEKYATEAGRKELPQVLFKTTLLVSITLNLIFAAIIGLYPELLQLWVGENFILTTGPILVVLVGAHCLRNIGAPYSLMLLATGLHKRALTSSLLEGASNVIASLIFGYKWGALGVAYGTLFGSIVGICTVLLFNTKSTPELTPKRLLYISQTIIIPILLFSPLQYLLIKWQFSRGFLG